MPVSRLYSDALLQLYFLIIQVIGVFCWLQGRATNGLLQPVMISAPVLAGWVSGGLLAALALGHAMATFTDAGLSY